MSYKEYPARTTEKPFRCDICHDVFNYDGIDHMEVRVSEQNREYGLYLCKGCKASGHTLAEVK